MDSLAERPDCGRNIGLVYFYFDFRSSEKCSTSVILRCIIAQLSQMAKRFPSAVGDMYDRYKGRHSQSSTEELIELLISISRQNFDRIYIFLDALDECNEREILLPALKHLVERNVASFFLSSRREQDITQSLSVLLIPILVHNGADFNQFGGPYGTALQAAATMAILRLFASSFKMAHLSARSEVRLVYP